MGDRTTMDPTAAALLAQSAERDQLRAENDRLSRALVAAYTEVEVLRADLARREQPTAVFVLMADTDGTLRSSDASIGVAVTTRAEADRFVEEGGVGYTRAYVEVRVFADKGAALRHRSLLTAKVSP